MTELSPTVERRKVALVTGAARNIGRAIAERLSHDGWKLVVVDRDKHGEEVAVAIGGLFVQADVANEAQVQRAVEATIDRYGHLDALICNAAIAEPELGPLHELSSERWREQLAVNLDGPFLCAKHSCRALADRRGSIVHITSTRAFMSEANTFAYSASKGALEALTHAMAVSLGPNIRVNAVAPGWIHGGAPDQLRAVDHEQHPVGRVGRPSDVAAAVAYLVDDDASFMTGQTLVVDGGMTRKMIYAD